MDSKSRFNTQTKDPFAGSVLFGAGNSPQASQALSPAMSQSVGGFGVSPMQAMDGVSTIRSPYQARRFGTQDSAQKRVAGGRSTTKRPPLSSILDDKIDLYATGGAAENDSFNPGSTGPLAMEKNEYANNGLSRTAEKEFPLYPSSSLRRDIFGNAGTQSERVNGTFASPTPARPPLRSMMDGFSVDRNSSERLSEYTPSGNRGAGATQAQAQTGAYRGGGLEGLRSPVLTLGPYTPSIDRLEAAWNSWIVVSGFYPSAASRQSVLQLFLQFGDIEDHVLTSGNWLFIKYVSPVHAERAASLHGSFLNSDTLLSVLVLNARLAQHMNLQLSRDGSLVVPNTATVLDTSVAVPAGTSQNGASGAQLGGGLRQRAGISSGALQEAGKQGIEETSRLVEDTVQKGHARCIRANSVPELYLQPHRRKNLCERIMEYFFAY